LFEPFILEGDSVVDFRPYIPVVKRTHEKAGFSVTLTSGEEKLDFSRYIMV
jgi:hypothetical protein